MLIGSLELEVGLKVHPSLLLEDMGSNQAVHMDALPLLLFTTLSHDRLLAVLLEVFEFELIILAERAICKCHSHLVSVTVSIFLNILHKVPWILQLALMFDL